MRAQVSRSWERLSIHVVKRRASTSVQRYPVIQYESDHHIVYAPNALWHVPSLSNKVVLPPPTCILRGTTFALKVPNESRKLFRTRTIVPKVSVGRRVAVT